ncbi:MAG: hypothetical protein CK532_04815 [Flavobacteriales bacterium]|nr:MAG: hypothetical protein CK532_04815 [Flavobacteriales bacterium]
MKRILLTLALFTAAGLQSQDWGGGGGWGSTPETAPKGGKGEPSSPGMVEPKKDVEIVIPKIGTHYDDPMVPHYEPEYVNHDTNIRNLQGIVMPRPYIRNADVKFRKRVWRVIDLRQKMNKSWTWPKNPISQVLWEFGTKGLLRAYATDSFNLIITPEDIIRITSEIITTSKQRPGSDDPSDLVDTSFPEYFSWNLIQKFEIIEDWVFDYKHGEFKPIIIGIAPIQPKMIMGQSYDVKPFWLKMDDCRPTLAKSEVFNRYNDAMRLNWDQHINHHRLFDSYIVKTSEFDDRYIYQKPEFKQDLLGNLLRAEEVKNDLFIFEHDLWEY